MKIENSIKIAEFIYNLPLKMGFSRYSKFQQIMLNLGDKIVFSKIFCK